MNLTVDQKQKYLEYVEKKKLEYAGKALPNSANQSTFQDFFSWCVSDIIQKSEEVEFYKQSSEENKNNFKINIVQSILTSVTADLVKDISGISQENNEPELLENLLENENMDEFFEKLAFYISQSQSLANNFIRYTAFYYVELCTKLKLLADQSVYEILR